MLRTADLKAWLSTQLPGVAVLTLDQSQPMPDRQVVVELTGGAGTVQERAYDRQSVQVRTRGAQRDRADAEALAAEVDDVMLGAATPVDMGGPGAAHVNSIDRIGGPPAFLSMDESQRTTFACNYMLQVARTKF